MFFTRILYKSLCAFRVKEWFDLNKAFVSFCIWTSRPIKTDCELSLVIYNVSNFSIFKSTKIWHDIRYRQYFTWILQAVGTSLMRSSRMILSLHLSSAQYRNRTVQCTVYSVQCTLFPTVNLPGISLSLSHWFFLFNRPNIETWNCIFPHFFFLPRRISNHFVPPAYYLLGINSKLKRSVLQ